MARRRAVIEGMIELDRPRRLDGAVAEVQLRAVGMADAAATIVARSRIAPPAGPADRLPFRIETEIEEDSDYALAAEVRLGGGEALAPGDLLTVAHHGWRFAGAGPAILQVKEIS